MRKQLLAALLALVLCGTATADLYVDIATSGGSWPQAPYIITPTSGAPAWMPASFETFCVERYTTFSPGNYRATIDEDIRYPGGGPKELTAEAKQIYAAYLNNELTAFTATQVQNSVWGALSYGTYEILDGIETVLGNAAAISGWQAVKVLNLWGANNEDLQSQMVMTPVPGAALLGVLGIGFASTQLRRRRRSAEA